MAKTTIAKEQNPVTFQIKVDWQDLLDYDIDSLNTFAENEFNKNKDDDVILSDFGYKLIGQDGDTLTFLVSALIAPMW